MKSETFELEYAFLLSGTHSDIDSFTFCNGVTFSSIELLRESYLKDSLLNKVLNGSIGQASIMSVLKAPYRANRRIESATIDPQEPGGLKITTPPHSVLEDTRLILSLARSGRYGVPVAAHCEVVPKSLSFLSSGVNWWSRDEPQYQLSPYSIEFELKEADKLLKRFNNLTDDVKDSLRIALARYNKSKINSDWVEKFIDLRVCMENLFLREDETDGIVSILKTRISENSTLTKTKVANYYGELSCAVHRGKLPEEVKTPYDELLELLKARIRLVIETGKYPDWVCDKKQKDSL